MKGLISIMGNLSIAEIIYELYKIDWVATHITQKQREKVELEYKEYVEHFNDEVTFEGYLEQYGYDGEIYASFKEFLENEYQDTEYVESLMRELIRLYNLDIEGI